MATKVTIADTKKKNQFGALIGSLILLAVSGAILYFAVTTSGPGGTAEQQLDVRPVPEGVRTDLGGFTAERPAIPTTIETLKSKHQNYFSPDASPIPPAEGDDNPVAP